MSLGAVRTDLHEDVIKLNRQDVGFKFGSGWCGQPFYENSKAGLKKFLNNYAFDKDYPLLYMSERVFLNDEDAKRQEAAYHAALDRVVWTDNPDVSFVPNYDTRTKSKTNKKEFKLTTRKWKGGKKNGYYDNVLTPGIKGDVSNYLTNLTKGGKEIVINSINLVHTHYYSMNDKEVQVDFTVITKEEKKALAKVREDIRLAEEAAAKAKAEAEEAKKKAEKEAKQVAIKMVEASEYGKTATVKGSDYNTVIRFLAEGKMTEQFLNARKVADLISEEKMKDKDYMRIACILEKSMLGKNMPFARPTLIESIDIWKARKLAMQQGEKIKDEDKRMRRKAAANAIGAGWLAECF